MSRFRLEQSVGSVVAEAPETAQVFERLHIDTRCGRRASLARACRRFGVHPDDLFAALDGVVSEGSSLPEGPEATGAGEGSR